MIYLKGQKKNFKKKKLHIRVHILKIFLQKLTKRNKKYKNYSILKLKKSEFYKEF